MTLRLLALLGLVLLCGCGTPAVTAGATTPMDAATLFATIATLSGARPFTAAVVSKATGAKLRDTPQSNAYFKIQRADKGAAGGFDTVEVREPTAQSAGKGGMVILGLSQPCVKRADVGDRFGAAADLGPSVPSPHAPADSPEYDTHPQGWGALKLGYRPSDGCLVSVVLDANG